MLAIAEALKQRSSSRVFILKPRGSVDDSTGLAIAEALEQCSSSQLFTLELRELRRGRLQQQFREQHLSAFRLDPGASEASSSNGFGSSSNKAGSDDGLGSLRAPARAAPATASGAPPARPAPATAPVCLPVGSKAPWLGSLPASSPAQQLARELCSLPECFCQLLPAQPF